MAVAMAGARALGVLHSYCAAAALATQRQPSKPNTVHNSELTLSHAACAGPFPSRLYLDQCLCSLPQPAQHSG